MRHAATARYTDQIFRNLEVRFLKPELTAAAVKGNVLILQECIGEGSAWSFKKGQRALIQK